MRGGEEIRWIEIFLRGGDAWQLFRYHAERFTDRGDIAIREG
jgi:hypothetical protein